MAETRMTKKEREKRRRVLLWIFLPLVVLLLVFSGLVTISEQMNRPFLPTWERIFEAAGLRDAPPLSDLEGELRIDVIEVGNADSILIRNGTHNMLIDAGTNPAGQDVVNYLHNQGVQRLDLMIATHGDVDHIGGMDNVIDAFEIDTFIMAFMPEGFEPTTKSYLSVLQALDKNNIAVTEAAPGASYPLGDAAVEILGPVREFEERNNMSVVCRVSFGNRRFLFMGDAEKEEEASLLETGTDLAADVIKIGHHGSRSSSSAALLDAVAPRYALITSGVDNSYNHPHQVTLDALAKRHIACYRSDLCGTIVVRCDGDAITFETER